MYVKDAHGVARLFETDGHAVGDVPLAGLGTIGGFTGESRDQETFFSYTDYASPLTIYRYDPRTNMASAWRTPRIWEGPSVDTSCSGPEAVDGSTRWPS